MEDKSLKPIQYLTPGLLGWAIASGARSGPRSRWSAGGKNKLLRRLRLAPVCTSSVVTARIGVSLAVAHRPDVRVHRHRHTAYFGLKLTAYWWMAIPVVIAGTLAFLSIGLLVGALPKPSRRPPRSPT